MTATEHQVLAIVRELVAELGGQNRVDPALDSSLDRELGLSSLEQVELLLRLERAFRVQLGDAVLANAVSPRDLAVAVEQASPMRPEGAAAPVAHVAGAAVIPESARTLIDVLTWHAERTPDRIHVYLRD